MATLPRAAMPATVRVRAKRRSGADRRAVHVVVSLAAGARAVLVRRVRGRPHGSLEAAARKAQDRSRGSAEAAGRGDVDAADPPTGDQGLGLGRSFVDAGRRPGRAAPSRPVARRWRSASAMLRAARPAGLALASLASADLGLVGRLGSCAACCVHADDDGAGAGASDRGWRLGAVSDGLGCRRGDVGSDLGASRRRDAHDRGARRRTRRGDGRRRRRRSRRSGPASPRHGGAG